MTVNLKWFPKAQTRKTTLKQGKAPRENPADPARGRHEHIRNPTGEQHKKLHTGLTRVHAANAEHPKQNKGTIDWQGQTIRQQVPYYELN